MADAQDSESSARRARLRTDVRTRAEERPAVYRMVGGEGEVFGHGGLEGAAPARLEPEKAAEILLVARWFRRNPKELSRTRTPEDWLTERRPSS